MLDVANYVDSSVTKCGFHSFAGVAGSHLMTCVRDPVVHVFISFSLIHYVLRNDELRCFPFSLSLSVGNNNYNYTLLITIMI